MAWWGYIGEGKVNSSVSLIYHIGESACLGIVVVDYCCGIRPYIHCRIVFGVSTGKLLGAEL